MQALPVHDERRLSFASVLATRGQARAAYELAKPYAHFAEFSVPDDRKMELYARIAERAGHLQEAAWARERMGEDGHFRVWVRSQEYAFAQGRDGYAPDEYEHSVDFGMNRGLELYPSHREEIETLRQKLLAAQYSSL